MSHFFLKHILYGNQNTEIIIWWMFSGCTLCPVIPQRGILIITTPLFLHFGSQKLYLWRQDVLHWNRLNLQVCSELISLLPLRKISLETCQVRVLLDKLNLCIFHWVLETKILTACLNLAGKIIGITSVKMGFSKTSVKLKADQEAFDP